MNYSHVMHESQHYVVCFVKPGLVVHSKRRGGSGVLLPKLHDQFPSYLAAFKDLLDKQEGDDLCRALLRNA